MLYDNVITVEREKKHEKKNEQEVHEKADL